jgi:hypothetical protein
MRDQLENYSCHEPECNQRLQPQTLQITLIFRLLTAQPGLWLLKYNVSRLSLTPPEWPQSHLLRPQTNPPKIEFDTLGGLPNIGFGPVVIWRYICGMEKI